MSEYENNAVAAANNTSMAPPQSNVVKDLANANLITFAYLKALFEMSKTQNKPPHTCKNIFKQARIYVESVETSLAVAKCGVMLSTTALSVLKGEKTSQEQVMQAIAKEALELIQEVHTSFRNNRVNIYKEMHALEPHLSKSGYAFTTPGSAPVETDSQNIHAIDVRFLLATRALQRHLNGYNPDAPKNEVTDSQSIYSNDINSFLVKALDTREVVWGGESKGSYAKLKALFPGHRAKESQNARAMEIQCFLISIAIVLEQFAAVVTKFVDWWQNVLTDHETLLRNLPYQDADGMTTHWKGIQAQFQMYTSQITAQQDYYKGVTDKISHVENHWWHFFTGK